MAKSRAMSAALGLLVSADYSEVRQNIRPIKIIRWPSVRIHYHNKTMPTGRIPPTMDRKNDYTAEPIKKSNFEVPISMQPYTSKFIVPFAGNLGKSQDLELRARGHKFNVRK